MNITTELKEELKLKEWKKPGTDEIRYYLSNNLQIIGLSNREQSEFESTKWWLVENKDKIEIKTTMSFKETKHKYIKSAIAKIIAKDGLK